MSGDGFSSPARSSRQSIPRIRTDLGLQPELHGLTEESGPGRSPRSVDADLDDGILPRTQLGPVVDDARDNDGPFGFAHVGHADNLRQPG